jgi:hypothetical protein
MDPRPQQSQQRGNASRNQPGERALKPEVFSLMSRLDHQAHQSQNHQTNAAGSYAGGPPAGASYGYGQANQQPGEGARTVLRDLSVECANCSA